MNLYANCMNFSYYPYLKWCNYLPICCLLSYLCSFHLLFTSYLFLTFLSYFSAYNCFHCILWLLVHLIFFCNKPRKNPTTLCCQRKRKKHAPNYPGQRFVPPASADRSFCGEAAGFRHAADLLLVTSLLTCVPTPFLSLVLTRPSSPLLPNSWRDSVFHAGWAALGEVTPGFRPRFS